MNPRSLLWLGAGRLARLSVTELPRHVNVTAVRRSAVDFAAQHICADISCAEGMAAALATKPDYVVFSMSPDARSEAAYRTSYLRPMQLLIQGLAQRDWRPTVIAVSSSSVWAQDQGPVINENFAPLSQSPTAKVLIEMEKALQMSTLPHCIVRFSGIYGAGRFHLIRQVQSGNYGRVINIISTSVKIPLNGLGVSNTIRGAVASWAKTMANELGAFGITVNNVLPGFTSTGRLDEIIDNKVAKTQLEKTSVVADMEATVPMRRFAHPSEVAAAVVFLASPAASYITGISLPVDGGRTQCL